MTEYSYFHPNPRRNPLGLTTMKAVASLAGLGAILVGSKYAVAAVRDRKVEPVSLPPVGGEEKKPAPTPDVSVLSGVYADGATLGANDFDVFIAELGKQNLAYKDGAIAFTTASIVQPPAGFPGQDEFPLITQAENLMIRGQSGDLVPLSYQVTLPNGEVMFQVDNDALLNMGIAFDVSDDVTFADGSPEGAMQQVSRLVTDLTGSAARSVFATALDLVVNRDYLVDEPSGTRDDLVRKALAKVAPKFDWSAGPDKLSVGTPAWRVWMGADLVGQLAYQLAWNARA